jgi:ElaB/YqjD/DUF883 family membrane-anchored ribosome-binding protein
LQETEKKIDEIMLEIKKLREENDELLKNYNRSYKQAEKTEKV